MTKLCNNCGTVNEENAKYCKNCGFELKINKKIKKKPNDYNNIKKKISNLKLKNVIIILLILVVASLSIFYAFNIANINTYTGETYTVSYPSDGSYSLDSFGVDFYNHNDEEIGYVMEDYYSSSNLNQFKEYISESDTVHSAENINLNGQQAFKVESTASDGNEDINYAFSDSSILLVVHKNISGSDKLVNNFKIK